MRFSLLILCAVFVCNVTVRAHPNLQNAMWVQFKPARVHVAVNVSLKEIAIAQGFALGGSDGTGKVSFGRAAERHGDYVLKHLALSTGTRVLEGRIIKRNPPSTFGEPEQTCYQYELVYPISGPPPVEVTFFQNMLQEWPYAVGAAWTFLTSCGRSARRATKLNRGSCRAARR